MMRFLQGKKTLMKLNKKRSMIEKEIMIGNYFLDRGGKVLRVDYWERPNMIAQRMFVYEDVVGHPLTEEVEYLKGIDINPEWLGKLLYTKEETNEITPNIESYSNGRIVVAFQSGKLCYVGIGNQRVNHNNIKHVHHFQNLFKILTNENV